ncbi:MAG: hypothetical protein ACYTFY_23585, partial [Planctomycetota bacterium]
MPKKSICIIILFLFSIQLKTPARSIYLSNYSDRWDSDAFGNAENKSINLRKAYPVNIFLGTEIEKGVHPLFDSRKGTFEFFFKLNKDPKKTRQNGLPFVIPFKDTASFHHKGFLHLGYKNGILMHAHSEKHEKRLGYFGPWKNYTGPVNVAPDVWHHFAIEWILNKDGKFYGMAFIDGKPLKGEKTGGSALAVRELAGLIRFTSGGREISIDELRISNICRYKGKEFTVTDVPFETDENCLALYHFDGSRSNAVINDEVFQKNAVTVNTGI